MAPMRRNALAPVNSRLSSRPSLSRPPKPSRESEDPRRFSRRTTTSSSVSTTHRMSSRPSMSYGSSKRMQDPRPLHDKAYMKSQVEILIRFAIDHGYQHPLSPKILSNPSGRDFQNIFMFLIKSIDPNFELRKKFEEEVISLIKALGYPFSISKSALSAVGSPHTWPSLLGVLMWLVGQVKYKEAKLHKEANSEGISIEQQRQKLVYTNVVAAYDQFLQGADEYPELNKELLDPLLEDKQKRLDALEEQEKEIEELQQRLEALKSQPSPLELAKDHEESLLVNTKKFEALIPTLEEHAESVSQERAKQNKLISGDEEQLAGLLEEKAVLDGELKDQWDAGIDSDRIKSEIKQLEALKSKTSHQKQEADAHQRDAEEKETTSLLLLEQKLKDYHVLVWKLEKTAVDAAYKNMTLRVSADPTEKRIGKVLNRDLDTEIIPLVHRLKVQLDKGLPDLQKESLRYQEKVEQSEEHFIVLQDELSVWEERAKDLEDRYQTALKSMREQRSVWSRSILEKERQMSNMISSQEEKLKEIQEEERKIRDVLCMVDVRIAGRRSRLTVIAERQKSLASEHKERAEKCWRDLKSYLDSVEIS